MQERESMYTVADGKLSMVGELRYDVPRCSEFCPPETLNIVVLLCCLNGNALQGGTFRTVAIVLDADDPKDLEANPKRLRRTGVSWGISPEFWIGTKPSDVSIV